MYYMGYKSKKPKGLKVTKASQPPSDYNKSIFDWDDTVFYDKEIIDYLGSRRRRDFPPVWTVNYPYQDLRTDFARKNSFRNVDMNYPPPMGYQLLSVLHRNNRYTPGYGL